MFIPFILSKIKPWKAVQYHLQEKELMTRKVILFFLKEKENVFYPQVFHMQLSFQQIFLKMSSNAVKAAVLSAPRLKTAPWL